MQNRMVMRNGRYVARDWEVDQRAVDELAAELGLRKPVLVEVDVLMDRTHLGGHTPTDEVHFVGVNAHVSAGAANFALLHEMQHAVQAEREGTWKMLRQYGDEQAAVGYSAISYEREANRFALDHERTTKLVKKVS